MNTPPSVAREAADADAVRCARHQIAECVLAHGAADRKRGHVEAFANDRKLKTVNSSLGRNITRRRRSSRRAALSAVAAAAPPPDRKSVLTPPHKAELKNTLCVKARHLCPIRHGANKRAGPRVDNVRRARAQVVQRVGAGAGRELLAKDLIHIKFADDAEAKLGNFGDSPDRFGVYLRRDEGRIAEGAVPLKGRIVLPNIGDGRGDGAESAGADNLRPRPPLHSVGPHHAGLHQVDGGGGDLEDLGGDG